jgi:hypothetical protein
MTRKETTAPSSKLVISVLFSKAGALEKRVMEDLEATFGKIEWVSERMPFFHTRYYEEEMGPGLFRRMTFFKEPVPSDGLVQIKHHAQGLEDRFRDLQGRRTCNVDPGLLSLENFILSTHKAYSHRIYLGEGVYAEVTLVFHKGSYRPLQWTYPDYASEDMIGLLNLARGILLWQRRRGG